jgi:outer membrane protein assembly factor BamD (BamD/ComL family)
MNSPRKSLVVLIAALCAGLALDSAAAPKNKEKTIGDLSSRPVVVQPDQKVEASSQRAMENYRRFLELQKTDPQLRAEALRRLADLNMEAGEGDRMAGEASMIDAQGAEAIKLYTNLLKSYPDYPRNDQVLYQLARAYETTGQPEKALSSLDEILRRYPKSPQMDEVQFRRGELLFSAKQYRPAQDAYAYVVSKGDKAPFLTQSLYKHGWSLFKQGLNDDSLPSFAGVLDRTLLTKQNRQLIPIDKLPRAIQVLERFRTNNPKSEYSADVTRKLAVAYGETGQAGQAAVEFERIALNPAESRDIQREANLQAADLYAKAGNQPKAVGMLERFIVSYPTPVADSIEARQKLADIAGTAGNIERQRHWQREIVAADRTAGAGRPRSR